MTVHHFLAAQHLSPLPPAGKPSACGFGWEAKFYLALQKPKEATFALSSPLADGTHTGV